MDNAYFEPLPPGDHTSLIRAPSSLRPTTPSLSSHPILSETNSISMSIPPSIPTPPILWSPANAIRHATEPSQGYGRLRHLDRMKREQHALAAHEPLVMKWDMQDLSKIIEALESCSKGPQKQKKAWQDKRDETASRFDPRAPHFDVVLIDLTNAPESQHAEDTENSNDDGDDAEELKESEVLWEEKDSGGDESQYNPRKIKRKNRVRKDIVDLSMESLAGRPGWLFLWVGNTENMPEGRRILGKFGFRKVECIGWMKTTNGAWNEVPILEDEYLSSMPTGNGVLRRGLEWCLVGVKGTAKRTYDSHLIHCNVSTDVLVCDSLCAPKSSLLSRIIENFSMGQRRLHLFAKPGDERPGWLCVGKDFEETTFDCRKYMRFWEEKGKHGWLMPFDPEIEYFRPKTPPLQVRKRERTNINHTATKSPSGSVNNKGKWEDDAPKFIHTGQRKRPTMRYTCPEDDPMIHIKVLSPTSGNRGTDNSLESTQFMGQPVPKIRLDYQNTHSTQFRSASDPKPNTRAIKIYPSTGTRNLSPSGFSQEVLQSTDSPVRADIQPQTSSSVSSSPAGDYYFLSNGRIPTKANVSSSDVDSPPMPYQQYLLQPSKPIRSRGPSSLTSPTGSQQRRIGVPSTPRSHKSMSIPGSPQPPPPFGLRPMESHQANFSFPGPVGTKPLNSNITIPIPISVRNGSYQNTLSGGPHGNPFLGDITGNMHNMPQNIRRRSMPGAEFFNLPGNMQPDAPQNARRALSNAGFTSPVHEGPGIQYPNAQYLYVPRQGAPPAVNHVGPVNNIIARPQPAVYPGYGQQQEYQQMQQQQPIHILQQQGYQQRQQSVQMQMPQQQINMQRAQQIQQHMRVQQIPSAYPIHQSHPQQIYNQGQQPQLQMQSQQQPRFQPHLQPQSQFRPYNANSFQH